jgi:hypothetical protein
VNAAIMMRTGMVLSRSIRAACCELDGVSECLWSSPMIKLYGLRLVYCALRIAHPFDGASCSHQAVGGHHFPSDFKKAPKPQLRPRSADRCCL